MRVGGDRFFVELYTAHPDDAAAPAGARASARARARRGPASAATLEAWAASRTRARRAAARARASTRADLGNGTYAGTWRLDAGARHVLRAYHAVRGGLRGDYYDDAHVGLHRASPGYVDVAALEHRARARARQRRRQHRALDAARTAPRAAAVDAHHGGALAGALATGRLGLPVLSRVDAHVNFTWGGGRVSPTLAIS